MSRRQAARPAAGKGPGPIRMPLEAGGLGPARHIPQPDRVVRRARGQPPVRQQAKGLNRTRMPLEAGGLGAARHIPQPDRVVRRARGQPPVRQQAKGRTPSECPSRRAVSAPVATSHSQIVLSPSPRRAARPAAGKGPEPDPYALRGGRSRPRVATSHSRIVLSSRARGEPPVRQQAKGRTPFVCPSRRAVSAPVATSHSRIVLSQSPRRAARPAAGKGPEPQCMPFEAGGLGPGRHIPQPDRLVTRARGEPPVRQQAKGLNRTRMPFEAGGLGPRRHIPQPDRVVLRARGEPPVRQQAKGLNPIRMPFEAGGLGARRHIPQPDRVVPEPEASRPSGSRQRA